MGLFAFLGRWLDRPKPREPRQVGDGLWLLPCGAYWQGDTPKPCPLCERHYGEHRGMMLIEEDELLY